MNAFRKTSLVVLVAFVAVLALGVFQSSVEAGGHGHGHKHGHFHHGHNHHGHFHVKYPSYNYWPTYQYVKPISYPVTYYDCYGQPYIVWQTSYSNLSW